MIATIIANYNYGQYLGDAIDSSINQTVQNYTIVIDDGSTDNSVDIALSKIKTKHFKTWQNHNIYLGDIGCLIKLDKNYGPSYARNCALSLFIADPNFKFTHFQILDADDQMYPNKIERLLTLDDNRTGVVYADYDIWNVESNTIVREYKQSFSLERLHRECIIHSGSLIKKEALLSVYNGSFYNNEMVTCEDYELWVRIAKRQWKIKHIPESLTLVRNHPQNSTNTRSQEIWLKNWQRVHEQLYSSN